MDYATFRRGGVAFPLTADTTDSLLQDADPAIFWTLAYLSSVITTHVGARLVAEAARVNAPIAQAVQQVVSFDPAHTLTTAQYSFPLLAVYRKSATYPRRTVVLTHNIDKWGVAYVLPPLSAGQQEACLPILHAVAAVVDNRLTQGHDPTFQNDAPVWSIAGLEEISLDNAAYGQFDAATGDMFFPAWRAEFTVRERDMPTGSVNPLAGLDVAIPVFDLASNSLTPNVAAVQTDASLNVPRDLPGCKLWLRASVGLLEFGSTVLSWSDRSGNGLTAESVGYPKLLPKAFNGQSALSFDGTTQASVIAGIASLRPTTGVTLFAVYRSRTVLPSGRGIVTCQSSAGFTDGFGLVSGPATGQLSFFVNSTGHVGGTVNADPGVWRLAVGVYDGSHVSLYVNGALVGTQATYGAAIAYSGTPPLTIGAYNTSSGPAGFSPIDVAETGLYSRALSTGELASLNEMLMSRYALVA